MTNSNLTKKYYTMDFVICKEVLKIFCVRFSVLVKEKPHQKNCGDNDDPAKQEIY